MNKQFKTKASAFNNYLAFSIVLIIIAVVCFVALNIFPVALFIFATFSLLLGYWAKDRTLITLHKNHIEAKEAIAANKKLIRYKDIEKIEEHKTGRIVTVYLKKQANKKETIALTALEKTEKKLFLKLFQDKINATKQ